jgi:hypothetical protein
LIRVGRLGAAPLGITPARSSDDLPAPETPETINTTGVLSVLDSRLKPPAWELNLSDSADQRWSCGVVGCGRGIVDIVDLKGVIADLKGCRVADLDRLHTAVAGRFCVPFLVLHPWPLPVGMSRCPVK